MISTVYLNSGLGVGNHNIKNYTISIRLIVVHVIDNLYDVL